MAVTPWSGMIGKRVVGSGSMDATVALLAEAPGADEEELGRPLIGRSGQFLFDGSRDIDPHVWPGLTRLGLGRTQVRVENVIETRPLNNDLGTVTAESLTAWQAESLSRLAKLPKLQIIVAMGNLALATLRQEMPKLRKLRSGDREWRWQSPIGSWRGSVGEIIVGDRPVKFIPTYHPAYFLHGGGTNFQAWRRDWEKVVTLMRGNLDERFPTPRFRHLVAPTWAEIDSWVIRFEETWNGDRKGSYLAFDIETIGSLIDCIGFCADGKMTLTLPLLSQLWEHPGECRRAWQLVEQLIRHPIAKTTHFGFYDVWRLERQKGWRVQNWKWDSYMMSHLLDPGDEHSLGYCAARDLALPAWKHERESKGDWKARHRYNGKDVGVTWWLTRVYLRRLQQGWGRQWQSFPIG